MGDRATDSRNGRRWLRARTRAPFNAGAVLLAVLTTVFSAAPQPAGAFELVFQRSFELPQESGLFDIDGMTYHPSTGNLIVSGGTTTLEEITTTGEFVDSIPYSASSNGPDGLQSLPNGNVLACEDSEIVEFDRATGSAVDGGIALDVGDSPLFIEDIEGLTFDPGSASIWVVTLPFTTALATDGSFRSEFSTAVLGFPDPKGVAFDPLTRNLLIVENDFNNLFITDTTGALVDQFDVFASSGLDNLNAVTLDDATRTVYVGSRTTVGVFELVPEPSRALMGFAALGTVLGLRRVRTSPRRAS